MVRWHVHNTIRSYDSCELLHHILYPAAMVQAEWWSYFELTKDTPYDTLMGESFLVFLEEQGIVMIGEHSTIH